MSKRSIQSNQKFGALVTITYSTVKQAWECLCDCGKISYRNSSDLKNRKHPSCGCQRNIKTTLPDMLSLKRSILLSYKTNANKKGLSFNLTENQVFDLLSKDCKYCGSLPSNKVKTRRRKGRVYRPERNQEYTYNGIDRIDSKIGYTLENCVPCCSICNISKNDMSLDEWTRWISRVYSKAFNDYAKAVESSDSKQETPD
jgi:hypothetical protein